MTGLYVHVPFCKSKCPYCDFTSFVDNAGIHRYLEALKRESLLRGQGTVEVDTVYIGGGTPSALRPEQLVGLISMLRKSFVVVDGAEVTVELNPDDVNGSLLDALREGGVDRLSLGAQSFDDQALRFLGRRHNASGALEAIELIRGKGWSNLSIDVMYGWHFQSSESHMATLERALAFSPEHLSCYLLTIEGETLFSARLRSGSLKVADEETESHLFLLTHEVLVNAGYEHYEVSNYAMQGRRSRHNLKYWIHEPYLGLGPSAHSFDGARRRSWNTSNVEEYTIRALRGEGAEAGEETLTEEQLLLEKLLLGFRTIEGVDLAELSNIEGSAAVVRELIEEGLCKREQEHLVATTDGLLVVDSLPLRFLGS